MIKKVQEHRNKVSYFWIDFGAWYFFWLFEKFQRKSFKYKTHRCSTKPGLLENLESHTDWSGSGPPRKVWNFPTNYVCSFRDVQCLNSKIGDDW